MAVISRRPAAAMPVRSLAGVLTTGWERLALLAVVVLAAVWGLAGTGWADGRTPLAALAVGGLLLGWLLARWRALPGLVAHWLALLGGGALLLTLTGPAFAPGATGWPGQVEAIAFRFYLWVDAVERGQNGQDVLLTTFGAAALAFLLGYQAAWTLHRRDWFWWSILPSGLALMTALSFMSAPEPWPLALFLVAAVALLGRHHLHDRQRRWRARGLPAPVTLAWRALSVGVVTTLVLTSVGWQLPAMARDERLRALWEEFNDPWLRAESAWQDVFDPTGESSLFVSGSYTSFGPGFEISNAPRLTDEPVARLTGNEPHYLRAVSYDRYTGRGWQTTTPESLTAAGDSGTLFSSQVQLGPTVRLPLPSQMPPPEQAEITYLRPMGALLLAPGQFVTARMPVNVRVSWERYDDTVIPVQSVNLAEIPTVLQPLVTLLRQTQDLPAVIGPNDVDRGQPGTPGQAREMEAIRGEIARLARQRGIIATVTPDADGRVATLRLTGPVPRYDDVEGVYAPQPMPVGTPYRVLAARPDARADDLRAVTAPAPAWLNDRYLALPDSLPERVRALATTITEGKTTAYDKVRALEQSLRTLPYDDTTTGAPAGQDVVDYFLFDLRRGHCEYFASALAVMARSLGIPARVVTGFNPGEAEAGSRLIRERNAHAWVEIYFENYGWVSFEPTPSVAALNRGEEPANLTPPLDLSNDDVFTPEEWPAPEATDTEPAPITSASETLPTWLERALQVVRIVVAVALVIGGGLAFLWWRDMRGLRGAARWYGRLQWLGRWLGLRSTSTTTPLEFADTVARAAPGTAEPARAIATLYASERYGGKPISRAQEATAERHWRRLRGALARRGLRPRPRQSKNGTHGV